MVRSSVQRDDELETTGDALGNEGRMTKSHRLVGVVPFEGSRESIREMTFKEIIVKNLTKLAKCTNL